MTLGGDDPTTRTKVGINIAAQSRPIIQQQMPLLTIQEAWLQRPSGNQWRVFLDPAQLCVPVQQQFIFYIEPVSATSISFDERLKQI
jgi:hypothetical protein